MPETYLEQRTMALRLSGCLLSGKPWTTTTATTIITCRKRTSNVLKITEPPSNIRNHHKSPVSASQISPMKTQFQPLLEAIPSRRVNRWWGYLCVCGLEMISGNVLPTSRFHALAVASWDILEIRLVQEYFLSFVTLIQFFFDKCVFLIANVRCNPFDYRARYRWACHCMRRVYALFARILPLEKKKAMRSEGT